MTGDQRWDGGWSLPRSGVRDHAMSLQQDITVVYINPHIMWIHHVNYTSVYVIQKNKKGLHKHKKQGLLTPKIFKIFKF